MHFYLNGVSTASLSTCKQQRERKIKNIAKKIRTNFSSPQYPTVHFDGKVVKYLSGEAHDHEAVCLSAPTQLDNPQFLGAPILDPPTGENTANVTISMLEAWGITFNDLFCYSVGHNSCEHWRRPWCMCLY